MRLLNTISYILEEFTGNDIPRYAILSHRWGNQEITFQDIQNFKNFRDYFKTRKSTKSEGWAKIKGACEEAVLAGYEWIWVDSCCIDKTSSAELSEAINSMFNWYRKAQVCYAYLSDVFIGFSEDNTRTSYEFRNSKWFRRGWTLQELLAPRKLVFFNRYWVDLGDRKQLWPLVSSSTGIQNEVGWETASVAQKMSWASKRETTRTEDKAYSLMGLFGVNMPPLYGEGENAFIRLQLEILRTSDDESIFAWRDDRDLSGGLLASSPGAFQHSGNIKRFESVHYDKPPYSMTNKGLRMEFPLLTAWYFQKSALDGDDTYLAPLQCQSGDSKGLFAILLRWIKGNQYRRISSGELVSMADWDLHTLSRIERDPGLRKIVQVKQDDESQLSFRGLYQYMLSVASNVLTLKGFDVTDRYISASNKEGTHWKANGQEVFLIDRVGGEEGVTAALEFTEALNEYEDDVIKERERFFVVFNIYATRARLAIIVPRGLGDRGPMHAILARWITPGDWLTATYPYLPPKKLKSGVEIIAKLIWNQNEVGLRSYEAEILFEEPAELPGSQEYHYELLPGLVELPNNEVQSFTKRKPFNEISSDPERNWYIQSFLIHRELISGTIEECMLELPNNEVQSLVRKNPMSPDPEHNYHIRSFLMYKATEEEKRQYKAIEKDSSGLVSLLENKQPQESDQVSSILEEIEQGMSNQREIDSKKIVAKETCEESFAEREIVHKENDPQEIDSD